jgi:glycosyltransferase involved in cell wall biosynthesis
MEVRKPSLEAPSCLKKELTNIAIYHDALLQNGGAEKVALMWAQKLRYPITVLAWNNKETVTNEIAPKVMLKFIKSQKVLEYSFPLLPAILPFLKRNKEMIRLVSTTGLAHHFKGYWDKRILYIHSPARWIWDAESFNLGRKRSQVAFANLLRPFFKYYDRKSIKKNDVLLVNSYTTREKVRKAYSRDSQVLFPPVAKFNGTVRQFPLPKNYEHFFLQVGRVRGYKGYDFLIEVFKDSEFRLIMVGEGTEKIQNESILGLGFVSECELAWLYESAQALLAVSKEDFGLTPVEAAFYGCPTIAFKQNGYLDSVRDGISGQHVVPNNVEIMKKALLEFDRTKYNSIKMLEFAREFSIENHMSKLEKYF